MSLEIDYKIAYEIECFKSAQYLKMYNEKDTEVNRLELELDEAKQHIERLKTGKWIMDN